MIIHVETSDRREISFYAKHSSQFRYTCIIIIIIFKDSIIEDIIYGFDISKKCIIYIYNFNIIKILEIGLKI